MTASKKTSRPDQQQPTQQAQGKAPTERDTKTSDYGLLRDMYDPDDEVITDDQGNEITVDRVAFRSY